MAQSPMHQAFATPFYRRVWPQADDVNEGLREIVLARMPAAPPAHRSNVGGWHSANDLLSWGGPAVDQLLKWIQTAVAEANEGIGTRPDGQITLFAWANVLTDGGYNRVHDHDAFTWSGVYYVDAGEGVIGASPNGYLEFVDPRSGVGAAFSKTVQLRPEPGAMVLFPGWLKHFVHPYRGGRPRISIAFNVHIPPTRT